MSLHPDFPTSPYAPLLPEQRWFPADETLRATAYEKLLPPLVAKIREEVRKWRASGYAGSSGTSHALLRHWFEEGHLLENADGSLSPFSYYFAQREAVETVIWLYEVRRARDKFDLLRDPWPIHDRRQGYRYLRQRHDVTHPGECVLAQLGDWEKQ